MRKVFADTSAFVSLFYEKDENHNRASMLLNLLKESKKVLVTTDYIFDECVTGVLSNVGHDAAVRAGEYLLNSAVINIISLDQSVKVKAWEYFKLHDDKQFSFTDCTSFVLMNELNIKHYFAFDDDFKRAGFVPFT